MVKYQVKYTSFFMILMIMITYIQFSFSFSINNSIAYIQSNQIWDLTDEYGGFKNSIIENSSVKTTAQAIISLMKLSVENQTINEGALTYLSGCEQVEGGFSSDSKSAIPTLRSTFWAISALKTLKNLDWVNPESILWIIARQLLNTSEPWNFGGFENKVNGSSSTMEYTFYGIIALQIFSKLSEFNSDATISWVTSKQLNDGGFKLSEGVGFSDLSSTYYAVSILSALNGLELVNNTSLLSYLSQKQNLNLFDLINYGGFGNVPNVLCKGMETFFAIESLNILNALNRINISLAIQYLENLQLTNGGFTAFNGLEEPTVTHSYYSLISILTLSFDEIPDTPDYTSSIWVFVLICILGISGLFVIKYVQQRKRKQRRLMRPRNRRNSHLFCLKLKLKANLKEHFKLI